MNDSFLKILALAIFPCAILFTPSHATAQSSPPKQATTWQDLGFGHLPEGAHADLIPLLEGLNLARGTWSFEAKIAGETAEEAVEGKLQIEGNPRSGMVAVWQLIWSWPADDPGRMIAYNIMAGPGKEGIDLMLIRIGPMKDPKNEKSTPRVLPTPFKGTWNLEKRTITWTERSLRSRPPVQKSEQDPAKPKQVFEMIVAADGRISIEDSEHPLSGQFTISKAMTQTAKAPAQTDTLTGQHRFKTAAEVLDPRIQPWLPPQATEISLLSERNGHYARYRVEESHFMKFLDGLWEVDNGKSAHRRGEMGEGQAGNPQRIAKLLKTTGNESFTNFKIYLSPSKRSSAMTTYFYERESGIAYHDRGYW